MCCVVLLTLFVGYGNAMAKRPKKSRNDQGVVSAIALDVVRIEACARKRGCTVASGPMQLDLLELADGKVDFANQVLLPEKTRELRLVLGENNTITVDDESFPLIVPSGKRSGLKLKGGKAFPEEGGLLSGLKVKLNLKRQLVVRTKRVRSKENGKRRNTSFVNSYKLNSVIKVQSAEVAALLPEERTAVVAMPDKESEITVGDTFSLSIPAGAVSTPMVISVKETKYTVEVMDEETGEVVEKPALSSNYELSPDGAEFDEPLQIALPYYPDVLPSDVSEYDLAVYLDGERIPTDVNTMSRTATADVWHFTSASVSYEGGQTFQTQMPVYFQEWNFGYRFLTDERPDYITFHPGTDLNAAGDGAGNVVVRAIAEGKVVANSHNWGGIVIEHSLGGKTYYSQYGHIKHLADETNLVSGKSTVKRGQPVGYIGDVGASGVFHLHFEIRSSFHPDPDKADYWTTNFLKNRKNVFSAYESPLAFVRSYLNPDQTVVIVEDSVTYPSISDDISGNKVFFNGKVIKECFFEPDNLSEWNSYVASTGENRAFGGNYHYASTVAGNETKSGKWYFDIPQAGKYKIYASIPHGYATAEKANYEIFHNNQVDHVVINQNAVDGSLDERWAPLGVFDFKSGNNHYVRLGNNTGETGKYVALDAIQLVQVSASDDPEPTSCPSGNGLYCGSVNSSLDNNALYYCQDGNYQVQEQCVNGCEVMSSGVSDRCMVVQASCPSGNGLYCGSVDSSLNNNTLYDCQNGNYQV
ncbi:MAG: hypothetical protein D3925_13345, partial [Candidatus Electrothrix sp. AR5]|nr:hypothetical protein [Candidatus Electrothrix sp. AR5]